MTRDEIIRMAGEAGIRIAGPMDTIDPRNLYAHELERFAALVAAAEREAALEKNNLTWVANCQHLVAAEREACAQMVMPLDESLADEIRTRGDKPCK